MTQQRKEHYDRQIPEHARAADAVHEFINSHPEGVTVNQLTHRYKMDLSSTLAAIDLLFTEWIKEDPITHVDRAALESVRKVGHGSCRTDYSRVALLLGELFHVGAIGCELRLQIDMVVLLLSARFWGYERARSSGVEGGAFSGTFLVGVVALGGFGAGSGIEGTMR